MIQVKCTVCGTTNRLEGFSYKRIPYCGACKLQLSEPFSVVALRFFNSIKYWVILAAIGLGAFLVNGSKPESGSTPPPAALSSSPAPSVHDQFTDQPVIAKPSSKPLEFIQGINNISTDAPLVAPLSILTPRGQERYFVKLVDSTTGSPIMTINVHGGQSFTTKVPLGRMKLRYASGLVWYGDEANLLFGEETVTSESDDVFDFYESDGGFSGYTVELIKQVNGNMHTRTIPRSHF